MTRRAGLSQVLGIRTGAYSRSFYGTASMVRIRAAVNYRSVPVITLNSILENLVLTDWSLAPRWYGASHLPFPNNEVRIVDVLALPFSNICQLWFTVTPTLMILLGFWNTSYAYLELPVSPGLRRAGSSMSDDQRTGLSERRRKHNACQDQNHRDLLDHVSGKASDLVHVPMSNTQNDSAPRDPQGPNQYERVLVNLRKLHSPGHIHTFAFPYNDTCMSAQI
ncbi:hypothetical protein EDC04DRAFT_2602415 [Pisolithus marmoratus]|nr:hypothetical protein EDC04DRAFT_2602415 [Pisolithus marmoratus]